MKKLLAYWPYAILSLILSGYVLLARQSPFNYSLISIASFLIFYFFSAVNLIGDTWALIATFLLAFSATSLSASHDNIIFLLSPISIILAIEFFLFYVRKSSRLLLAISGILIGLSMAVVREAWVVAPLLMFLVLILALAKLGRDWPDIDPSMRRHKIRILFQKNFAIILSLALIILATVYIFFMIPYFNNTKQVSQSMLTNWLLNNIAFHPFGLYSLMLENKKLSLGINWIKVVATQESIPLILFLGFGIALYLIRLVRSFLASFFVKLSMANYLGICEREFFYALFIAIFGLINIADTNTSLMQILLLPYLIFISVNSIKEWFLVSDGKLARNISIKILIFKNNFLNLSLKTGALSIILIWHLVVAVKNYL